MHTYMHTYIHSRTNMFVQSRRQISGRTLMHAMPKFSIIAALLSLLATSSKILKTLHEPWFTCSKVEWKSPTPWQALRRVRTALRQRTGCSLHRIQSKTRSSCSDSKHDRVEIVGDPHLTSEPRRNVWRNALSVIASASGRAGFARGSTARSRARISMCCRRARRDFALSAKASTPAVEPHRGGQIGHRHTIHARTFRYSRGDSGTNSKSRTQLGHLHAERFGRCCCVQLAEVQFGLCSKVGQDCGGQQLRCLVWQGCASLAHHYRRRR